MKFFHASNLTTSRVLCLFLVPQCIGIIMMKPVMKLNTLVMKLNTLVMKLNTLVMKLNTLVMKLNTLVMKLNTLVMKLNTLASTKLCVYFVLTCIMTFTDESYRSPATVVGTIPTHDHTTCGR
ncbi:hypothetical protein BaRGS_00020417 [Batillaria attramentaria]|uniref:Uncharacterized protein n=1 Tax=Batillaria attramentaria TaxID=370345 RepID=A0ABD0KNG5_9CAEN